MMAYKPRLLLLSLAVAVFISLALVACGGSSEVTSSAEGMEEAQVASATATETAVLPTEAMEATLPPEPMDETSPQAAEAEAESVKPTPRTELHATNPGQVSLASGQLQLLEFFAYW